MTDTAFGSSAMTRHHELDGFGGIGRQACSIPSSPRTGGAFVLAIEKRPKKLYTAVD